MTKYYYEHIISGKWKALIYNNILLERNKILIYTYYTKLDADFKRIEIHD